jgi:quinol monooxygenase YgiN
MSQIAFVVKLTAAEGKREEALAVLGKLVDATGTESGTLQYVLHTETADPNVIWFYELYADQQAFEAHTGSPTMAEVMGSLGGLLSGPADMRQLDIVTRKGEGEAG